MPFPTATVTQGAGLTINTLPNAGQATKANSLSVCVASDQNVNTNVSVTPVITASAYAAGNQLGGKMTFAIAGLGSGILESVNITSKSVQTTGINLYIFDTNPTNSTWTDKVTPAINAADVSFCRGVIAILNPNSGLGTHTVWNVEGLGMSFSSGNLYGIMVVTATPTWVSTSDVVVKLGIVAD